MPTQKRREELAERLIREGHIDAARQAAAYGVSHETIRRDLLYLEEIGLAKKGYGGATIAPSAGEPSFSEKYVEHPAEKRRIAAAARALIRPGDAVLLDSGSTVYALATLLALRPMDITVFTNSLKSAQALAGSGIPAYMLGGRIRPSSTAVTGAWAVRQLAELRVQAAFLGASGWDGEGPRVESFEEAQVKQAMIASAERAILLADSAKARGTAMLRFARWQALDALITDEGMAPAQLAALADRIRVTRV